MVTISFFIVAKECLSLWLYASLPEKEDFYSHVNMEDITRADYTQQKEFVKILK